MGRTISRVKLMIVLTVIVGRHVLLRRLAQEPVLHGTVAIVPRVRRVPIEVLEQSVLRSVHLPELHAVLPTQPVVVGLLRVGTAVRLVYMSLVPVYAHTHLNIYTQLCGCGCECYG